MTTIPADVLASDLWTEGPPLHAFKEMRKKCPVHRSEGREPFWSVTRAADADVVARDWESFTSTLGVFIGQAHLPLPLIQAMFLGMDPPRHDRLKALFLHGFTPKRVREREPFIRATVRRVLGGVEGEVDAASEIAGPIVSRVIGDYMGIPPQDDAAWTSLIQRIGYANDPVINPEGVSTVFDRDMPELARRCWDLVSNRRQAPQNDLANVLARAEVDGERLTDDEIMMGFFLFMLGGTDTTRSTYCHGLLMLMERPDQRQLLLDDPSLIPMFVEEVLRFHPAVTHMRRTTTREVKLGGATIPPGEPIVMWFSSANRDEDRYENPDEFDLLRDATHQSFGAGGRHFCLGAALARLELRVMFEETLARFPGMALVGRPERCRSSLGHGLRSLPVRVA